MLRVDAVSQAPVSLPSVVVQSPVTQCAEEFTMKPAALGLALAVTFAVSLWAQSSAPARSFDVADVHAAGRSPIATGARNGSLRDGVFRLRQATMVDLI